MKLKNETHSRLIDFLVASYPELSREKIKHALKFGNVTCNNFVITKATAALRKGDEIEMLIPKKQPPTIKFKPPFPIVYEDDSLIVMIKPAGILTIDYDNPEGTSFYHETLAYIKEKSMGKQRVHIVHRLDREVSGLIILAKSEEVRQELINNWKSSRKKYYALVEGRPEKDSDTIASWLMENEARMVYSAPKQEGSKHAVTHYKVLKRMPEHTLMELELETGRKNQLRIHMAEMGCPIVGDHRYGSKDKFIRQIRLMSYFLEFVHPVKQEKLKLEIPLPGWFTHLKSKNENYK